MKYLNKLTRTLVDFKPDDKPAPAFFTHEGKLIEIKRVVSQTPTRKTFDNCILYRCETMTKLVELRWDKDKDIWFIEKIGEKN